ncbi:4-amino-4-deoxy-L-arabinose transferase and related glycosyltransferase of PMT family [Candidatus Vecturithrix granuli]|uniref:4-amino-4-deoxy-L-arabinose transferase and related glycosyltransferase of PMT family n=1 Tax=Vecturithrix granuli TaxID=1499967 RepID=A0A081BZZ5_VECG1|nr:4-amino-4-deoxy-L-arabinose transferase and related glycosyltransferase of PMT family [Candidatus Vecturithrix granuli]
MNVSYSDRRKQAIMYGGVLSLFIIAGAVSLSYRSIWGTDIRGYIYRADAIYFNHQLPSAIGAISSVLYPVNIALAYPLVGHTLLATHLFNLLMWLLTPILFFFLLRRMLHNDIWAWIGAIIYLGYPTNFVLLNQNSTEVVLVFWLMVTFLLIEYGRTRPALLSLVGITCALMVLTRLFDGLLFTGILGIAICYDHRKRLPVRWLALGIMLFIGVQWVFSVILGYSLLETYDKYIRLGVDAYFLPTEQNSSGDRGVILNALAYTRWFLGKKWAPMFLLCIVPGCVHLLRKNRTAPAAAFLAYSMFLVFFLGGVFREPFFLRQAVKVIVPLVIVLICGAKMWYDWLNQALGRTGKWIAPSVFVIIFLGCASLFYHQNSVFIMIMEDIIPPSSLLKIIRSNPELPVFPPTGTEDVELRENMIKAVTGAYRPSYLSRVAQQAWEKGLPHQERAQADFAYHATFEDETSWRTDGVKITGTSPLWLAERPGHLGAFPYQAEATLVLMFTFPQKAQKIMISDIHSQWSPGDVLRMWTSSDGQRWTLRHDYALRYRKMYYHEELTEEIAGIKTLYVKYYFYAGDPSRDASDNRGAALDEFSLAVTFQSK